MGRRLAGLAPGAASAVPLLGVPPLGVPPLGVSPLGVPLLGVSLLALALSLGCGDAAVAHPADCMGLAHEDTMACAEERFWEAHTERYEAREATYDLLGAVIEQVPEGVDDVALGRLHFRRAALGMELMLEHGIDRTANVVPDLEAAIRLDPAEAKYPPWLDSMDLVLGFAFGDEARFDAAVERIDANVARYPVGNVLSITGTMSGFPLETGLPQKAVRMLEGWECTEGWCMRNTERAPYSQPGLEVHFADAYARVGDTAQARAHLEAALVAEDAESWPYRDWVEETLADLDGYVALYTELGEEGSAVPLVYANSDFGCTLCHGAVPPR